MSNDPSVTRAIRVARALALAGGIASLAACTDTTNGTMDSGMIIVGGGSACSCDDAGTTSGACSADQLDAGCHTLLGAGPLPPPELDA